MEQEGIPKVRGRVSKDFLLQVELILFIYLFFLQNSCLEVDCVLDYSRMKHAPTEFYELIFLEVES